MVTRPVREILTRDRSLVGRTDDTVQAAAAAMAEHRCGSILVCDGDQLRGIFTERDLLVRVVAAGRDAARTRLAEVMTREPDTIAGSKPVVEAVRRMDEGGYHHLPVREDGRILGVIALRDVPLDVMVRLQPELEQRHLLAERLWERASRARGGRGGRRRSACRRRGGTVSSARAARCVRWAAACRDGSAWGLPAAWMLAERRL